MTIPFTWRERCSYLEEEVVIPFTWRDGGHPLYLEEEVTIPFT